MTPEQKVKSLILLKAFAWLDQPAPALSADSIDDLYEKTEQDEPDYIQDARSEVRSGQAETGLPCDYSRNYEAKAVAAQAPDGTWVGWTYWYGGGKHSEPEAIDWMADAYDVACVEDEKTLLVRTFSKPETAAA
jgi:hypothetical protein